MDPPFSESGMAQAVFAESILQQATTGRYRKLIGCTTDVLQLLGKRRGPRAVMHAIYELQGNEWMGSLLADCTSLMACVAPLVRGAICLVVGFLGS